MKRRLFSMALAALVLLALCSCTAVQKVKPWGERTPEEKSLTILQTYNRLYAETKDQAEKMVLAPSAYSQAQKDVVNGKRAALIELKPLVGVYLSTVINGGVPDPQTEQKIVDLIRKLGGNL